MTGIGRPVVNPAPLCAFLVIACAGLHGNGAGPSFDRLDGWGADDHAATLAVFQQACVTVRNTELDRVCRRALALRNPDEAQSRAFLESNFRLRPIAGSGLLTAYFAPEYQARHSRGDDFTAPVRPRPIDLPQLDRPPRVASPYAERATIEARGVSDCLAWMRPEELFILQIQGSGTLVFDDGARVRAVFDGSNGAPYLAIGAVLKRRGSIGPQASAEDIRRWLTANRGPRANAVMRLNRRYVFFRLATDDGSQPSGTAGSPLAPGRSIAVDPSRHHPGELFWLDARPSASAPPAPSYRRLVVALDTGGAIRGEARADLYLGRGYAAGLEAGRVKERLRLFRLAPIGPR